MLRFEFSRRAIRIDQSERSLRENSGAPVRARSPVGTLNLRLETGRPAAHNAIMPEVSPYSVYVKPDPDRPGRYRWQLHESRGCAFSLKERHLTLSRQVLGSWPMP
jgi:hypothetical protein